MAPSSVGEGVRGGFMSPAAATRTGHHSPREPPPLLPSPRWDGLDIAPLRDLASRTLISALRSINEAKTLLIDPGLAGSLGLIVDLSGLKELGVEKMFWLDEGRGVSGDGNEDLSQRSPPAAASTPSVKTPLVKLNAPTQAVVYICKPEVKWMKVIAGHVLADGRSFHQPQLKHIRDESRASSPALQHSYSILFTPRRTESCLLSLAELAVLPYVSILDCGLEFIPLSADLLSLEDNSAFREIYHDGDHRSIYHSAQALMTVQHAYGLFPRIVGKGDLAKRLSDLLIRQRREYLALDPNNPALTTASEKIDCLIIVDRSIDFATTLCTQLTYEGLVDEVFGISACHVEFKEGGISGSSSSVRIDHRGSGNQALASSSSSASSAATARPKIVKKKLDAATDSLYSTIRDDNFAVVPPRLQEASIRLREGANERHQAQTIQQVRHFVLEKLKPLQNDSQKLSLHTSLTEKIQNVTIGEEFSRILEIQQNLVAGIDLAGQQTAIEDLINAEVPLLVVLRLLCLLSVVGGGIKPKNLEFVKREILQTYGYEFLPILLALSKVGLLTKATPSSSRGSTGFSAVRKALRLLVDDVDERDPDDVGYVFSSYAPLSIRLVQAVAQKEALVQSPLQKPAPAGTNWQTRLPKAHPIVGWTGFEDIVERLPGRTFDERQSVTLKVAADGTAASSAAESQSDVPIRRNLSNSDSTTSTLVFFLGGVTYAEVASLRFMSRRSRNRRFIVATTNMINGNSMVDGLVEGLDLGSRYTSTI